MRVDRMKENHHNKLHPMVYFIKGFLPFLAIILAFGFSLYLLIGSGLSIRAIIASIFLTTITTGVSLFVFRKITYDTPKKIVIDNKKMTIHYLRKICEIPISDIRYSFRNFESKEIIIFTHYYKWFSLSNLDEKSLQSILDALKKRGIEIKDPEKWGNYSYSKQKYIVKKNDYKDS